MVPEDRSYGLRGARVRLLFTGRGTSGSWKIRGEQVARALGADAVPLALDPARYDAVVLVKRGPTDLIQRVHRAGVPLVWDVVDAWPQPDGSRWDRPECMAWLRGTLNRIEPAAVIAATRSMAADLREITDRPVICIPHHGRPGAQINPIREKVRVVGYEGGVQYMDHAIDKIMKASLALDFDFIVNPTQLAELDIVLALRNVDGYAARNWKSNVKLANAQITGTPVICSLEAGALETAGDSGGPVFVADVTEAIAAIADLSDHAERLAISADLLANAITLEQTAKVYAAFLEQVCTTAPSC